MIRHPTGKITFLFTDIEGSTPLWEHYPEEMAIAFRRQETIMRETMAQHEGYAYKMIGDAFQVAFQEPLAALKAAVAAQHALTREAWGKIGTLRLRMGLHTGEVEERSDDYVGPLINRVARIMSAGHGGQILLSKTTADLVHDTLPPGMQLRPLGMHHLKGLIEPEQIYQVVVEGLRSEFPPLATVKRPQHNLVVPPTPLIGREAEVETIGALLRDPRRRLLTLTGPGGTGKTRLSQSVAERMLPYFAHGVYFVALAPLREAKLVLSTIAQVLGVSEEGGQSLLAQLQEHLREKEVLLVLDNFEQVLEAGRQVSDLLGAAPRLKLLATSRVALHLRGEQILPVAPLGTPPIGAEQLEEVREAEAVQLFVARAEEASQGFGLTTENAGVVARISQRLEGLPLALELAAARVGTLALDVLLAGLGSSLNVLIDGPLDLPERQQTLRGTIHWSYELLESREQWLFRRLAVFLGGCTLASAEAVCENGGSGLDVAKGLTSLVDKSLLRYLGSPAEGAAPRYQMLETIREYAFEQLVAEAELETVQARHAKYFVAMAEEAEPQLRGSQQKQWLERLEQEHNNLRAVLGWSHTSEVQGELARRLAAAIWWFWYVHGHWTEALRQIETLLAMANFGKDRGTATRRDGLNQGLLSTRAKLLLGLGNFVAHQGDFERALDLVRQSFTMYSVIGDKQGMAITLLYEGFAMQHIGEYKKAIIFLERSRVLAEESGDLWTTATGLLGMGELALRLGKWKRAAAALQNALALCQQLQDTRGIAATLATLGATRTRQGEVAEGKALLQESIRMRHILGDKGGIAWCIERLAETFLARQSDEAAASRAVTLLGGAHAIRESIGAAISPVDQPLVEATLNAVRARIGDERFTTIWTRALRMTHEAIIEHALKA